MNIIRLSNMHIPVNIRKTPDYNKSSRQSITFSGIPNPSNIIYNYDNSVPSFIFPIDISRKINGRSYVFDMAIGNPDLYPSQKAIEKLKESSLDGKSHRYSMNVGEYRFRKTISDWYEKRYGIKDIDPEKNVLITSGGANGIDLLLMSYCNPNDKILIPNIGYPVYKDLVVKNNLVGIKYNLDSNRDYQIDFDKLEQADIAGVKAMIINYPHNPTGVFAQDETLEKALEFCKKHNILLIHDFDSSEISHNGQMPKSILEFDSKGENSAVVHTMSKSHNLPGMRVGFIVSNPETISNALAVKNMSEQNTYVAIQEAATEALTDQEYIEKINDIYRRRKNFLCERLNEFGIKAQPSQGTYYMWVKVPDDFTNTDFAKYLLYKFGVAVTPGNVFDSKDTKHVRIVLSQSIDNMKIIFDRIKQSGANLSSQNSEDNISLYSHPIYSYNPRLISDYQIKLLQKIEQLKLNYANKSQQYQRLMPSLDYIMNNPNPKELSYVAYNSKTHQDEILTLNEILPFSSDEKYKEIKAQIAEWIEYENLTKTGKILNSYKNLELYPDLTYLTLTDSTGKLQAICAFKKLENGMLRSRLLNTAPWNQTKDVEFKAAGKHILLSQYRYALECGIKAISYEVAPHHVKFYKNLGAYEDGTIEFNGKEYIKMVLPIPVKDMKLLSRY